MPCHAEQQISIRYMLEDVEPLLEVFKARSELEDQLASKLLHMMKQALRNGMIAGKNLGSACH